MIIMVGITIMLPQLSGLATYKKNPDYISKRREKREVEYKDAAANAAFQSERAYTYSAPDANIDGDNSEAVTTSSASKFGTMRSTLNKFAHPNFTERDLPVKLELTGENELKKRLKRKSSSTSTSIYSDPNKFDYDIDELIEEENQKDVLESKKEAESKYGLSEV